MQTIKHSHNSMCIEWEKNEVFFKVFDYGTLDCKNPCCLTVIIVVNFEF